MFSKKLSDDVLAELKDIALECSAFQKESKLTCAEGCGKCCFKKDVSCSPIELLPLAFDLLEKGVAESTYDRALENKNNHCLFLEIHNEATGQGKCQAYEFRPLVCRIFGVVGRKGKNEIDQYSVCKVLKEEKAEVYENFIGRKIILNTSIPYVENFKRRLSSFDPAFFEQEFPINQSLLIILEKLLMNSQMAKASQETL